MSSTIIANRWNHPVEKRLAWICTYPSPERRLTVMVKVGCWTEFLPSATKQMCAHPLIISVDEATGRRDVLLTIMAPDVAMLTALTIDWVGGIDGVYGTRSSLATNAIVGVEPWQAGILTQR